MHTRSTSRALESLDGDLTNERTVTVNTVTLSLFDDSAARLAGLNATLKTAMQRTIAASGLSREQVLDRMNTLAKQAGVKLTTGNAHQLSLATLDKWLNPADREHLPSVLALHVFCLAVNNVQPLAQLLGLHGCGVMTAEDRRLRDYGQVCWESKRRRKAARQLELELEHGLSHGRR
ncbi:hypothetical protein DVU_2687 [Nitratidesulfovibrio vulgaris str. Hildenborough]|uniref:Uncharacterized protein n=1 Tax=Nitratidesulfovibrio vulgaris (strain ATCC 29579 / DSM 644 / CCUG 34227 / NCIMB 8303 / VKM B-1760 / Hildenborough) TaxID=882 RepID=Q728B7_NITV2|nr:hypothetical protein DVU_2687 [Nitratidesulfovibrio vulgaris str. Hildenborough]